VEKWAIAQSKLSWISKNQPQRIFIIEIDEYVYLVPFVESKEEIFLKTMYPSRTMKKKYLGK
jgi:hypothetical protein